MRGGRPAAWLLGVLVLSAIVITVPAGRRPFWSSDEARYALLGQDVLERGQWLVAQLREQPYLNKPQLFFWTVAVVSMPFGRVSEATAAIPPVIASLVGVIGVIAIGHLLWGWWTGVVAGLVLVTTRSFDLRPMAAAIAAHVPPSGTVLGHPDVRLAYNFYVRRHIVEMRDGADVRTRVATAPPEAILVSADRWRVLALPEAAAWRVLASNRLGNRTIMLLGRPSP